MKEIFTHWEMNWLVLTGIVALLFVYGKTIGFRGKHSIFFLVSMLLLFICFFSPLHLLAMHYLFSAHMVVHVVLLLLAAPLLLLSIPQEYKGTGSGFLQNISKLIYRQPLIAWISGIGIMWLWHIPALFKLMIGNHAHSASLIHPLQTLTLLAAGFIFSMPLLSPYKQFRIHVLTGVLYLFTACTCCSLLGLWITFAPAGTFPHYLSMSDPHGLNSVIQNQLGISQASDQQAAGLIMWVPCCMVYVSGAMFLLWRWFNEAESTSIPVKNISTTLKAESHEYRA